MSIFTPSAHRAHWTFTSRNIQDLTPEWIKANQPKDGGAWIIWAENGWKHTTDWIKPDLQVKRVAGT